MARRYEIGIATVAAAAGATYAAIRAGSTNRIRIREIQVILNAATASSVGLIRSATVGTATTSTLFQALDPNDPASGTNVDTVWSSAPTISGTPVYLRRFTAPATAGLGDTWTWTPDSPLIVSASASVLIWNYGAGAGSVLQANISIEE